MFSDALTSVYSNTNRKKRLAYMKNERVNELKNKSMIHKTIRFKVTPIVP